MNDGLTFDNSKPNFGSRDTGTEVPSNIKSENKRSDVGAIWKRTSKNDLEYLTLQLELNKEELLEKLKNSDDKFVINLVAFANKYKEGNAKRPDYKLYEEQPRN